MKPLLSADFYFPVQKRLGTFAKVASLQCKQAAQINAVSTSCVYFSFVFDVLQKLRQNTHRMHLLH
jgi:hypothetical protein